jgi:uncharacterized RDD family membrane protein YckC
VTDSTDPYATPPTDGATPTRPVTEPAPSAQPPYAQPPYGQPPYGQLPYGQPSWGTQTAGELASWGRRVGGRLIDTFITIVPAAIIGSIARSNGLYDVVAIGIGLVIGYLNGAQGQSPGKRAVGLRLIRESDGQLIGGGMGVVREVAHILDTLSLLIGWLWPLWDKKKQTFADKVCGTLVVRT